MLYFDASFLVPLVLEESTSDSVERFIEQQTEQLAVSSWTQVEVSSVLAREVRMGGLNRDEAIEADAEFESILLETFIVLVPRADDFALAKQYLSRYESGLRTGDALHLAIAGNHRATAVYSLDRRLVAAGRRLGLPVRTGIRVPYSAP